MPFYFYFIIIIIIIIVIICIVFLFFCFFKKERVMHKACLIVDAPRNVEFFLISIAPWAYIRELKQRRF